VAPTGPTMTAARGGGGRHLVIMANRLPVEPRHDDGPDDHPWRRATGGMVTALAPIVEARQGSWIGWDRHIGTDPVADGGIELFPIALSKRVARWYYDGFSNSTIWPIYHDFESMAQFQRGWWWAYKAVNQRFAAEAIRVIDADATVWVQDYQLQLVPALLRQSRPGLRIGFFLHIPVPAPAAFRQVPHHREILRGLLGADLIGVQRDGDAEALLRL
jgi:trehalose 6-phosphate synthase